MSPWKIVCLLGCLLLAGLVVLGGARGWAWATGRSPLPRDVGSLEEVAPARSRDGLLFSQPEVRMHTKVTKIRHEFPFTNTSSRVITISKVRTSCGRCSSGKPAQDACAPGERGVIALEVDAQGQAPGPKGYTATVEFRDPEPREARLILVVDYEPEVQIIPAAMTFTLPVGKTAAGRFRLIDSRVDPFRSVRFTTSIKGLRVTALKQGREAAIQEFEVAVEDNAEIPLGRTTGQVVIHSDGDDPPFRSLPVIVEKVARILVAPSPFYLKQVAGGEATGNIILSDIEGEQIALDKVEVSGKDVEAIFQRDAKLHPIITVKMRNPPNVGTSIIIRITVVRPCRQEIVVAIAGITS